MNKKATTVLYTLLLWLAGIGVAAAQANSIDRFEVSQQAGKTVVRVVTKEPLKGVPANFSVASPARIAGMPSKANDSASSGGTAKMLDHTMKPSMSTLPALRTTRLAQAQLSAASRMSTRPSAVTLASRWAAMTPMPATASASAPYCSGARRSRCMAAESAIVMAKSYLQDKKRVLPVAAHLTGQYGQKDMYVGVPVVIGAGGVEEVIEIALDDTAKAGLQVSIDAVKELLVACKGIDSSLA